MSFSPKKANQRTSRQDGEARWVWFLVGFVILGAAESRTGPVPFIHYGPLPSAHITVLGLILYFQKLFQKLVEGSEHALC